MDTENELLDLLKVGMDNRPGICPGGFTPVSTGDWTDEHKQQFREVVYKHDESGRHFVEVQNRSGSFWEGYERGDSDFFEVRAEERTVTVWVPV